MNDKLKPKERKFCRLLAEGYTGVDAYLAVHDTPSENRLNIATYAFHYKERIIKKLGYTGFLDLLGISDDAITRAHKDSLKSEDPRVKLSAVKLGYQVRGRLVEQQRTDMNVTGVPTTFTAWLRKDKEKADEDGPETDADPE